MLEGYCKLLYFFIFWLLDSLVAKYICQNLLYKLLILPTEYQNNICSFLQSIRNSLLQILENSAYPLDQVDIDRVLVSWNGMKMSFYGYSRKFTQNTDPFSSTAQYLTERKGPQFQLDHLVSLVQKLVLATSLLYQAVIREEIMNKFFKGNLFP